MQIRRWLAFVLMCAVMALSAAGCNTVRGVGQDIQEGGRAVEDAAR